jgi:hypothetical protein
MSAPPRLANRDARDLVRELRTAGVEVVLAGNGHLRARHPDGAVLVFAHTPRSWFRERHKVRAWLRRAESGRATTLTTRSGPTTAGNGAAGAPR